MGNFLHSTMHRNVLIRRAKVQDLIVSDMYHLTDENQIIILSPTFTLHAWPTRKTTHVTTEAESKNLHLPSISCEYLPSPCKF